MPHTSSPLTHGLERYRAYLQLLVRQRLDAQWQGKADASGIVQETPWKAHRGGGRTFAALAGTR
jgi:hypothetical protein